MCDLNHRRFGYDELSKDLGDAFSGLQPEKHRNKRPQFHQTVKAALDRAKELNIFWPLDDDVTNGVLDELFYGRHASSSTLYAVINYEYIHQQLS